MGTSKNKAKKKPKGKRTTGTRKTAKVASSLQPESPLPSAQPLLRRLNLRGPAPSANDTAPSGNVDESAAAAALVSLGGRHQSSREDSDLHFKDKKDDRIFAAMVPGVSEDDLGGNLDGGEHSQSSSESLSDSSNSESSSDSDDNETMSAIITSSPSSAAAARKNKFIIQFEVPFNGASRELEILSTVNFDTFLDQLATAMSTRKSLLSVARG
ncbi:hypothetical protein K438DRAFT_1746886 [Mycena galopus ATCC 62051]|nr:hypothetical protein K438DRAFT_1746886 [Mycena galopus ATCC 62051]